MAAQSPTLELSVEVSGPIHHDLKQVNAHLLDALAMFAVKHSFTLEEVRAEYTGMRRKNGQLYANYTISDIKYRSRKA